MSASLEAGPAPVPSPRPEPAAPAPAGVSRRLRTRRRGRLSSAALVLYALALAAGLGFGSAYLAVSSGFLLGAVKAGPWTAWPRVGARDADPYARAVIARRGDIPLGIGEGLAFTATGDGEGRPFDPACTYRFGSVTPPTRVWTLTFYDASGRLPSSDLARFTLVSTELLRDPDGRFTVRLSRDAQAGNWLRLPDQPGARLVLRLYDTPVAAGSAALDAAALPAIERQECAP